MTMPQLTSVKVSVGAESCVSDVGVLVSGNPAIRHIHLVVEAGHPLTGQLQHPLPAKLRKITIEGNRLALPRHMFEVGYI